MNQSSAKSHNNNCSLAPVPEKVKQRKKNHNTRSPLRDRHNTIATHYSSKDSNGSSSLSSVEAPRGCLRFCLSHSSSSNRVPFDSNKTSKSKFSKTPKSAPNVRKVRPKESSLKRTVFEKPVLDKLSGRKPSSKICKGSKKCSVSDPSGCNVKKGHGGSEELRLVVAEKCYNGDAILTPSWKVATGSEVILDNHEKSNTNISGSSNKTPPIQASVSPELQCGSSMVSTDTPACYGAGHVLSGITDKRKCRPRGILTIGNNDLGFGRAEAFDSDDDDNNKENAMEVFHNSSVSPVPSPAEASMHWLLSPCNEEDENQSRHSPLSPSSSNNVSSSGVKSNNKSTAAVGVRSLGTSFTSPGRIPDVQGKLGSPVPDSLAVLSLSCAMFSCDAEEASAEKFIKHPYDIDGENSPFSVDSLGSGNVIQTPESGSSSSRCGGFSWLSSDVHEKCFFDSELNLLENLKLATLSPKSRLSSWDPISSSFQFDCMTMTTDSVDISHFQKILNDRTSQISNSTSVNLSQSPMRISWREGLASRIFEMDEFDCCRCFSDEQEHENSYNVNNELMESPRSPVLKFDAGESNIVADGFGSMEFMDNLLGLDKKGKEELPPEIPCSCAESMSTDGGGLVCSNDSDWTQCYKNQLFKD